MPLLGVSYYKKGREVLAVFACGLWSILKVVDRVPLLPLFYDFMISCGDLLYLIVCKNKGYPTQKKCNPKEGKLYCKESYERNVLTKENVFISYCKI